MDHYDMPRKKAQRTIEREDQRRVSLYKRLGKSDYDNPQLYHLVLNMGKTDLDTAKNMICEMVVKKAKLAAS
jgi:cytidylate kinase